MGEALVAIVAAQIKGNKLLNKKDTTFSKEYLFNQSKFYIMKFTIEVEEFWLDREKDIEPALKKYLADEITNRIWLKIETKILQQIFDVTKDEIENLFPPKIKARIEEIIQSETIATSQGQKTLAEFVKYTFEKNSGWFSASDQITKLANKFGDEMKSRYDFQFAAQIVNKMKENNLLNEEEVKKLIGKKPE